MGGFASAQNGFSKALIRVTTFNPSTSKWVPGPSLPAPTGQGAAVTLASGDIVYAGGANNPTGGIANVWRLNSHKVHGNG